MLLSHPVAFAGITCSDEKTAKKDFCPLHCTIVPLMTLSAYSTNECVCL